MLFIKNKCFKLFVSCDGVHIKILLCTKIVVLVQVLQDFLIHT